MASWSDEEIVRAARAAQAAGGDPDLAARHLDVLFRRYQTKVAAWCLRISGRREEAADLAQEVFVRVYERLETFRFESSFATWLYLVTRSVTINRSISNRRRDADSIDDESFREPSAPGPSIEEEVSQAQLVGQLRAAIAADLEPLEAKILHLHFVDGLTLAAIDQLLELGNKSGARAFLVSAKRKLQRSFKGSAAGARAAAGRAMNGLHAAHAAHASNTGNTANTAASGATAKPAPSAGRAEDPRGDLS